MAAPNYTEPPSLEQEERQGLALYELVLRSRPAEPFTQADLDLLPEMDGYRYELLDGMLLVSPAPSIRHQRASRDLFRQLDAACPDDLEVLYAPLDYKPAEQRTFQPDLLVVRSADLVENRWLRRTPLLLVEVRSPSSRVLDLSAKEMAYAEAGVPLYWLLEPDQPAITVLELQRGRYREVAGAGPGEELTLQRPYPVRLRLG